MLERNLNAPLLAALEDTSVVFLQGARQTGKSTLAQALISPRWAARYLTLDDAVVLAGARADPAGFVSALAGPVILDEVQRAPDLALAIKAAVDRDRRPGRFLLTGSADVLLSPRLSDALAGRMEIRTLWPFSQGEIEGVREDFIDAAFAPGPFPSRVGSDAPAGGVADPTEIAERLVRGGFPEVVARRSPDRRHAWFGSYLSTILQRDVRELSNIEGLADLPRLVSLLAARSPGLLNYAELSRSIAMPQSTLKRYMTLLERTFLIQMLPAWSANLGKPLVKSPRLLLCDTGLAAHAVGLDRERLVSDAAQRGRLLESFVTLELLKQSSWSAVRPRLFHFRTTSGQEVDLVLEHPSGRIVGIEVKASASIGAREFRGLRALADAVPSRFVRGIVLYGGRETVAFGSRLHAMPIPSLWEVGRT